MQQIQKDGREKRAQAEQELAKIENELTNKLLEINARKSRLKQTNKIKTEEQAVTCKFFCFVIHLYCVEAE